MGKIKKKSSTKTYKKIKKMSRLIRTAKNYSRIGNTIRFSAEFPKEQEVTLPSPCDGLKFGKFSDFKNDQTVWLVEEWDLDAFKQQGPAYTDQSEFAKILEKLNQ